MFSSPNRIFPPMVVLVGSVVDDAMAGLDSTRLMVVAAAAVATVVNCLTNVRLGESYCGLLLLLLLKDHAWQQGKGTQVKTRRRVLAS